MSYRFISFWGSEEVAVAQKWAAQEIAWGLRSATVAMALSVRVSETVMIDNKVATFS